MAVPCAKAASHIFDYPDQDYLVRLTELERACRDFAPTAADSFGELRLRLSRLSLNELRELYTRTFDLSPACALYLSVHLFGEGSFKRAQLMTGLAEQYAAKGVPSNGELPDHLGVVLGALELLDPPEQRDLLTYCLKSGLEKMQVELLRQENPFVLAMQALEGLVDTWTLNAEVTCD